MPDREFLYASCDRRFLGFVDKGALNEAPFLYMLSSKQEVEIFYKGVDQFNQNKKALIIHGKNDRVLELKYSSAGKNLMEKLGMETQYVIKERGHGQAPDFYEIIESWLK